MMQLCTKERAGAVKAMSDWSRLQGHYNKGLDASTRYSCISSTVTERQPKRLELLSYA